MPWVTHHLGRRGSFLLHFALIWLCLGAYVLGSQNDIDPADAVLYEGWPIWLRASLWFVTGGLALLAAFWRRVQDVGWLALALLPAERLFGHLFSIYHYFVPGDPPGTIEGFVWLGMWAIILSFIVACAGMNEDTARAGDVVES